MPFNPFTDSALKAGFNDLSVFRQPDQSTPCADGDLCGFWGDIAGVGPYNATNTSTNCPIFHTNLLGGKPGLTWGTNGDKQLSLGTPAGLTGIEASGDFTILVAAMTMTSLQDCFLFGKNGGALNPWGLFYSTNDQGMTTFGERRGRLFGNNEFFVASASWDGTLGVFRTFINGACRSSDPSRPASDGTNPILIGNGFGGGATFYTWQGKVFAVCIYNRAISAGEQNQASDFLFNYYSQTPARNSLGYVIITDFNSIGMNVPEIIGGQMKGFSERIADLMGINYDLFYDLGWAGKATQNMNSFSATDRDPLIASFTPEKRKIVLLWEGTNDIGQGANSTTAHANMSTYISTAKTAGSQVQIVTTVWPEANNAGFNATRNACNTLILADKCGAQIVADLAADPIMGPDDSFNLHPTYWGDGVHPSNLGANTGSADFVTPITNAINLIFSGVYPFHHDPSHSGGFLEMGL